MIESDQYIIEEVRGGKSRRFAILVDRYKDRAMTLAYRIVGNRTEAEERVQDAFLRAFRNLDQFRGDASFGTWFYRIVYNLCLTSLTRRRDTGRVDLAEYEHEDALFVDSETPSPLERLEQQEFQTMLEAQIQNLPEKLRATITLFYVQEMSYEEIASTMDVPLGTVKTNLFRGRALLQKRVTDALKGDVKAA